METAHEDGGDVILLAREYPTESIYITNITNKLTELCRNGLLQNDFINTSCETRWGGGSCFARTRSLETAHENGGDAHLLARQRRVRRPQDPRQLLLLPDRYIFESMLIS